MVLLLRTKLLVPHVLSWPGPSETSRDSNESRLRALLLELRGSKVWKQTLMNSSFVFSQRTCGESWLLRNGRPPPHSWTSPRSLPTVQTAAHAHQHLGTSLSTWTTWNCVLRLVFSSVFRKKKHLQHPLNSDGLQPKARIEPIEALDFPIRIHACQRYTDRFTANIPRKIAAQMVLKGLKVRWHAFLLNPASSW